MIVLSNESELLPHPVDGLADFSRRVVLKHHDHVILWTCQDNYLQHLQTQPNVATQASRFKKKKEKRYLRNYFIIYPLMVAFHIWLAVSYSVRLLT